MENQELKYLLAIARHHSISRAAESLFISQPGLSRYLKEREKEIGGALFTRGKGELMPTELGKVYLRYAEQIETLEQECNRALREQAHRQHRLRLGIPASRVDDLLQLVVRLRDRNHGVEFIIQTGESYDIWERMISGDIDLAITNQYGPERTGILIRQEEIIMILPDGLRERLHLDERSQPEEDGIATVQGEWLCGETFYLSGERTLLGYFGRKILRHESIVPREIVLLDNAQLAREMAYLEGGIAFAVEAKARMRFQHLYRFPTPYHNRLCIYPVSEDAKHLVLPQAEDFGSYRALPEI